MPARVVIHLERQLQGDVAFTDNGLHLVSSTDRKSLEILPNCQLQPRQEYQVDLEVEPAGTALLLSDAQGGIRLIRRGDWIRRLEMVRWISGAVAVVLTTGAVVAYFGWPPFSGPDSATSGVGFAAAFAAGVPGCMTSRTLERTRTWFARQISP